MAALDDLFREHSPEASGCVYLPLTDAVPLTGPHGRFVKLVCIDDAELPIEATADQRHFPLLEPYISELRRARQDSDMDWPVVPLFQGHDGKWRFSWHAARRDMPELAASPEPEPELLDRAYRMQVSIPCTLAERFKATAAAKGMRHTDLLLALIRGAAT